MTDPNPAGNSPWGATGAPAPSAWSVAKVQHSYPLLVRDHGLGTAFGLLMRSLPYALARFGVLLAFSAGCLVWLVVMIGGAAWLGTHVAQAFGWGWFLLCLVGGGWFWGTVLRYTLHLIACGHVAVLTELITRGAVGNGSESMFAYGRRVVIARFGLVTALFGLNALVSGIIQSFHRTLDWIGELLPIPGLSAVASLLAMVMRAATRYLDKVILSYILARGDEESWGGAREGLIYYCQNAKPILQTSIWIVILERCLSFCLWLVLLIPAGAIVVLLPASVREAGAVMTLLVAALLAGTIRASFLKPLFLIMIMVRFHTVIEGQAINEDWNGRLASISGKFGELVRGTAPGPASA